MTTIVYADRVAKSELPPFLTQHYSPAFQIGGNSVNLVKHSTKDNVEQWIYATEDQLAGLSIEYIKCDCSSGKAVFSNTIANINKQIGDNKGRFLKITNKELHCELLEQGVERSIFIYALPNSIQMWTFSITSGSVYSVQDKFKTIKSIVNRHRYCEAMLKGNVSMGIWGPEIHEYASNLLQCNKKKEAVSVFKNLLATSPYNYKAHWDFLINSDDATAIATSAKIILENAEDSELISKAAKFLGTESVSFESIPVLSKNETGLQLILIPLTPCRPWLLEDVSKVYEEMTTIPVKIRRLKEKWNWSAPDRIPHQRLVQKILINIKGENIDFTDWTKDIYKKQLKSLVEQEDALTKYYVEDMIERIYNDSPQYFVNPYVDNLCEILKEYRSCDNRAMYVGITENNIYAGDNNYIFSSSTIKTGEGESLAGILSYHMMLSSTLQEEYESRKRLTERIAKELVPASLKQLGIPRSVDPRCPYSYSSGITRLDEKTLRLSEALKYNLKKIRETEGQLPIKWE